MNMTHAPNRNHGEVACPDAWAHEEALGAGAALGVDDGVGSAGEVGVGVTFPGLTFVGERFFRGGIGGRFALAVFASRRVPGLSAGSAQSSGHFEGAAAPSRLGATIVRTCKGASFLIHGRKIFRRREGMIPGLILGSFVVKARFGEGPR